jgi:hypothetical protein
MVGGVELGDLCAEPLLADAVVGRFAGSSAGNSAINVVVCGCGSLYAESSAINAGGCGTPGVSAGAGDVEVWG